MDWRKGEPRLINGNDQLPAMMFDGMEQAQ
jgi:hypothetical protein